MSGQLMYVADTVDTCRDQCMHAREKLKFFVFFPFFSKSIQNTIHNRAEHRHMYMHIILCTMYTVACTRTCVYSCTCVCNAETCHHSEH